MSQPGLGAPALLYVLACVFGCSTPEDPDVPEVIVDFGYTLRGTVTDRSTGAPLSEVEVWLGFPSLGDAGRFQLIHTTDSSGTFRYDPLGPGRPTSERFRFIREGYQMLERNGATAEQVGQFDFRLDIALKPLM